jgi:hypothetical protein
MSREYWRRRNVEAGAKLMKELSEIPPTLRLTKAQLRVLRELARHREPRTPAQLKEDLRLTGSPAATMRDLGLVHDCLDEHGEDHWAINAKGLARVHLYDQHERMKAEHFNARRAAKAQLVTDAVAAHRAQRISGVIKGLLILAALGSCLWWAILKNGAAP